MSIILKGIDLPKRGEVLTIDINNDGTVWVDTKEGDYWEKHTDSAIQIPTPHGRLIDGDALEAVFKDMAKCEWNQKAFPMSWAYAFEDTIDEIYDAPTILEAEE